MKMAGPRSELLFFIFIYLNVDLVLTFNHDSSSGGICSNEFEAQSYIATITRCFNIQLPQYHEWRLCEDGGEDFTCKNLKKYVSIIPSCIACDRTSTVQDRAACYQQQLNSAHCSIENSFSCVKKYGRCELQRHLVPVSPTTTTTTRPVDQTTGSSGSDATADFHYGSRCKPCKTCKCEDNADTDREEEASTGRLSVGVGVAMFFVGLILGALISCCICVFAPNLQRKSSSMVHGKVLKKVNCLNRGSTHASEHQSSSTDHDAPRPQPTAPSYNSADTYHDLNRQNTADSHTYTGLQSPTSDTSVHTDPAMSDTYNTPHDRVRQNPSISSPTYHVPQDDISHRPANGVPETGASQLPAANQNRDSNYDMPMSPNQNQDSVYDRTNQGGDTNWTGNVYNALRNYGNGTSSEYNSLAPGGMGGQSEGTSDDQNVDHQYFVLEAQGGTGAGARSPQPSAPDSEYTTDHNYFVLEKQN